MVRSSISANSAAEAEVYTVELFKEGGEGAGLSACNDSLPIALGPYDLHRIEGPDRLVMLCDRARVIRRSDRPV